MRWIDSNCMIGKQSAPHPFSVRTTEEIKSELVRCGIDGALVYHAYAKEYHPLDGNDKLMEEIEQDDFFKPVWVIIPGHTGEFPTPTSLFDEIIRHRVVGVRCFPGAQNHQFSMQEWSMGEIYNYLEQRKLPLFLDLDQTNWEEIHRICQAHPLLRLVVTGVGYRNARYFFPLLEYHPYLYLELSMYKNFNGLERLVSRFGSSRFLFGTGMPVYSPGPCKNMILTAELSQSDISNMAYKNIEKLMEEVIYE